MHKILLPFLLIPLLGLGACQPAENGSTNPDAANASTGGSNTPDVTNGSPTPPLDLSRDHLQGLDNNIDNAGHEPEPVLPQMFPSADQETDRKVRVEGSLLTDKEAAELEEVIDGVEVKVEMRTP
ncbi:MAG: hypothetical protein AAF993_09760 [Pseudomonadota bacterium]